MQAMLPFGAILLHRYWRFCVLVHPTHPSLLRRDRAYLPVGRQALDDFAYSITKQRLHAALNGYVEHVDGSGP